MKTCQRNYSYSLHRKTGDYRQKQLNETDMMGSENLHFITKQRKGYSTESEVMKSEQASAESVEGRRRRRRLSSEVEWTHHCATVVNSSYCITSKQCAPYRMKLNSQYLISK
jgi:hypothetical protein